MTYLRKVNRYKVTIKNEIKYNIDNNRMLSWIKWSDNATYTYLTNCIFTK